MNLATASPAAPISASTTFVLTILGFARLLTVRSAKGPPLPPRKPQLSPLAREIKKARPFDSPEQEAHLNLLRTAAQLGAAFETLLQPHGLSGPTYNVLRILRGAGDAGRACHEIAEHMVARGPDVTRLVDRLESRGLARRARTHTDRRVVITTISPAGLQILESLDQPILDLHKAQLGHLSRRELATLNDLLAKARRAT
ncbi:hypothetical protein PHYC_02159 [Phycisphaerales bacterium]|nr:hypothetical protein PHYC_02159 [Phycisphaerales bacterium]